MTVVNSQTFLLRYEAHYATPLGRKKGTKLTEAEEEAINKKRSNKTAAKYTERQKNGAVSDLSNKYSDIPTVQSFGTSILIFY